MGEHWPIRLQSDALRGAKCPGRAHFQSDLSRLVLRRDHDVLAAGLNPESRSWIAACHGDVPVVQVSRETFAAEVRAELGPSLLGEAVEGLERRLPHLSARRVVTRGQGAVFIAAALGLLLAWAWQPSAVLRGATILLSLLFAASGAFRTALAILGSARPPAAPVLPARADGLPSYTILVPMYREASVLPALVRALAALDYPKALLDIKLILEDDDLETIAAARALKLAPPFEMVLVPPGGPRTKPKAANYALGMARGELLVVYDAEDRPEPDQLLKAVAAFRAASRRTACLQARLNFYNARHNWLTRMFALDYALWFDVLLPGLERIGAPIPLGGTSNHFRTAVLRGVGGWDAFNVTEDADIGIRLAQMGYRVGMLDSTTFEEAPIAPGAWLRQRSRWLKGHIQTWLVHMRDPAMLMRRTGLLGFLAFQLFLGGGVVFALVNPLLWLVLTASLVLHSSLLVPGSSLVMNNVFLTYLAMIGPRRRGWHELTPYGLTVVAYWAMASLAGYRELWQLATRPFYWEKTVHGVSAPPQ